MKLNVGGIIALRDAVIAPNSPNRTGVMDFYERDLLSFQDFSKIDAVDSTVVIRKNNHV